MLITFSGLDGAGKSTLIAWLKESLERGNRRVAVFHMNDHVGAYAYLRAVRDRLFGGPPEDQDVRQDERDLERGVGHRDRAHQHAGPP